MIYIEYDDFDIETDFEYETDDESDDDKPPTMPPLAPASLSLVMEMNNVVHEATQTI